MFCKLCSSLSCLPLRWGHNFPAQHMHSLAAFTMTNLAQVPILNTSLCSMGIFLSIFPQRLNMSFFEQWCYGIIHYSVILFHRNVASMKRWNVCMNSVSCNLSVWEFYNAWNSIIHQTWLNWALVCLTYGWSVLSMQCSFLCFVFVFILVFFVYIIYVPNMHWNVHFYWSFTPWFKSPVEYVIFVKWASGTRPEKQP